MFDPTIYDNLKVVLEGAFYDLDAEGAFLITGREDLVDLASYSRTFRLEVRRQGGACRGAVSLVSTLADFAGELRKMHLAGDAPGARVLLQLDLPLSVSGRRAELEAYLAELWEHAFTMKAELILPWDGGEPGAENEDAGACRIRMTTSGKLDESDVESVEDIGRRLSMSLIYADRLAEECRGSGT
ncbi:MULTISPECIES: hypothetical protein [Paenibacillus]|uniref:hypothetical protein n=1 Tax=Paenibacillus TaxID=44249 RepID=UPI0022B93B86|nr:hypothetical protein [Paenibacillus caseinilyticus]MCZ8521754.1 hypothetical protein [Paenibacillus caseinilyticus]